MSEGAEAFTDALLNQGKIAEMSKNNDSITPSNNEYIKLSEFDWLSYLENNGIDASPEGAFLHIEESMDR